VRVPNESGYHHCNWTSRLRTSRPLEQSKKRAALSEDLDRLQGAGQFKMTATSCAFATTETGHMTL
jgi:hypothetical protein